MRLSLPPSLSRVYTPDVLTKRQHVSTEVLVLFTIHPRFATYDTSTHSPLEFPMIHCSFPRTIWMFLIFPLFFMQLLNILCLHLWSTVCYKVNFDLYNVQCINLGDLCFMKFTSSWSNLCMLVLFHYLLFMIPLIRVQKYISYSGT